MSKLYRPRCKGKCGDAECQASENAWRAMYGLAPMPAEAPDILILESKETPYTPIVMIESPYAGDVEKNLSYLRAALKDCLMRGEAPFASHGLYTQVLDDTVPKEREHGILAGFAFRSVSAYTVVYEDLGISPGMQWGIDHSHSKNIPVKYRTLPGWGKDCASTK